MKEHTSRAFARMISDFCKKRITPVLPPIESERVRHYLLGLIEEGLQPPRVYLGYDWQEIFTACAIGPDVPERLREALTPGLDAIVREFKKRPNAIRPLRTQNSVKARKLAPPPATKVISDLPERAELRGAATVRSADTPVGTSGKRNRGRKPRVIEEYPTPLFDRWDEPDSFHEALALHMRRHSETCWRLFGAITKPGERFDRTTLASWRRGAKAPRNLEMNRPRIAGGHLV